MRTTITLEPDVEALVARAMQERSLSFKAAINDGLRAGLGRSQPRVDYAFPTYDLGASDDLVRANRIAEELEDAALVHKIELGR